MRNEARGWRRHQLGTVLALWVGVVAWPTDAVLAQSDLNRVLERAQSAWLDHDVARLVRQSDTVRLHLPGVAAASLRPTQAAKLLADYLKPTQEVTFDIRGLRTLAEDHAYAEARRVFLVRGTAEERDETVFLGFRRLDGNWLLREVRVMP